ncbi:alpha/beta fold hydrolase, partial [Nocardia vinacea]|uniref:alpha/beta fold hydrolase n=1 Tax=Nocardia vinacea TaxID=96468 RepID=UPI0034285D8E
YTHTPDTKAFILEYTQNTNKHTQKPDGTLTPRTNTNNNGPDQQTRQHKIQGPPGNNTPENPNEPAAPAPRSTPTPSTDGSVRPPNSGFLQWIRSKGPRPENKNLALLYAGSGISAVGGIGLASYIPPLVYDMSGSAQLTGLTTAATQLAALLAQGPAGQLADKPGSRERLRKLSTTGAVIAGGAGGWVLSGLPGALEAVIGSAVVLQATDTIAATSTMIYGRRLAETQSQKDASITLNLLERQAAGALGTYGSQLIGRISSALPFFADAGSYAVRRWLLNQLPPVTSEPTPQTRLLDGARAVWRDPYLRGTGGLLLPSTFALWAGGVQMAEIVNTAGYSATTTGMLLSGTSTGVLLAAAAATRKRFIDRINVKWMHPVMLTAFGGLMTEYANTTNPWIIWPSSVVAGSLMMFSNQKILEYQAAVVPEETLGKANAAATIVGLTGGMLGSAFGGYLLEKAGGTATGLTNAALLFASAAASAGFAYVTRNRSDRKNEPGPAGDGSTAHGEPDTHTLDPADVKNCAIQLARVFRALALVDDGSPEPVGTHRKWDSKKNWKPVEATIGTQLRPAEYDGDPRFTALAESVRTKQDGIDMAIVAVDDGENAHILAFVNVEGQVLVFDTLIDDPDSTGTPHVRNYDGDENGDNKWQPKYHTVTKVFDAQYTIEDGKLTPVHKPLPWYRHTEHPHKLQGPPREQQPPGAHPEPTQSASEDAPSERRLTENADSGRRTAASQPDSESREAAERRPSTSRPAHTNRSDEQADTSPGSAAPTAPSVLNPSPWSSRKTPWSGKGGQQSAAAGPTSSPETNRPHSTRPGATQPTGSVGNQPHRPPAATTTPEGPDARKSASPWSGRKVGSPASTPARTGTGAAPAASADPLRRLVDELIAQDNPEQAVELLRENFRDNVFRWIQANMRDLQVTQEVFDQACASAITRLDQIGNRSLEQWVVVNAKNLMGQHREIAEIWQRIRDFVIRGAGSAASEQLLTALAEASTSQVRRHLRALESSHRKQIGRFEPRPTGPATPSVPRNPATESRALWKAARELVIAVAAERGVDAQLPSAPRLRTAAAEADAPLTEVRAPGADELAEPPIRRVPTHRGVVSDREVEVLNLLQEGMTHAQIAAFLQVKPRTVQNHQANAAAKLGTTGAVQTVMEARRLGLLARVNTEPSNTIRLDGREVELLRLMAEGLSDRAIAGRFGVATTTIIRRRARIGDELGVHERTPMLMKALRLGILDQHNADPAARPTPWTTPDGQPVNRASEPSTRTGSAGKGGTAPVGDRHEAAATPPASSQRPARAKPAGGAYKNALPKVEAAFAAALDAAAKGDTGKLEELRAAIRELNNPDREKVLLLRYERNADFAEIVTEIGGNRTEPWIKRMHRHAVQELAKILDAPRVRTRVRMTPEALVEKFAEAPSIEKLTEMAAHRGWPATLESELREAIRAGRLSEGQLLPTARGLATRLGLPTALVATVYRQLSAERYLESHTKAGTFVLPVPGAPGREYPEKLIGSPPAEPDGPASPPDNEPVELSQEVVDRIRILRARNIALTVRLARLAREGIAFRADPVNEAMDQILAEIARLRTTGTVIDDVPVVAGRDAQLAFDWVFADRLMPRARKMMWDYLVSRRNTTPAEAREMLTELMRVVARTTELSLGTDHARNAAELEALTAISDWTDQLTGGGQPTPVLLDPADPAGDGIPATPTPQPLERPSTASNSPTNPNNVRQEHDPVDSDRHLLGHHAVLPEDKVRAVPEPAETADLGRISKLYAAQMPDGRTAHFRLLGDPCGYPILVSPGTPVGIDGPLPDADELAKRGYAVIVVERPGYGNSDPLPGRTVADCARDIVHIATELFAFDHYSVLGRSGGGSVAIAVGALDPDHVDRVVSLVGTSPVLDGRGSWMANMAEANQAIYRSPDLRAMVSKITDMAREIAQDGTWLIRYNQDAFTTLDHMWVGTHRDLLARGYQRGLRNYIHAWADDSLQLVQPWGIGFDDYCVPVDIVHGSRDQFSPVSHSQTNAALIPTSTLYLFRGVTHMMGMDSLPVIAHHFRAERDAFWNQDPQRNEQRIAEIQRTESEPLPLPDWTYWSRGSWDAVADHDDADVRRPEVPEYLRKCLGQTVRAAWALGYDNATTPDQNAETWDELETSLHPGYTGIPTSHAAIIDIIATLENPDNKIEAIAFVIDDGEQAHSFLATSAGKGKTVIFDTNIPEPPTTPHEQPGQRIPRVRDGYQWEQTFPETFPDIRAAFKLEFIRDTEGRLQASPEPAPDGPTPEQREHKILGKPRHTGDDESDSTTRETDDARTRPETARAEDAGSVTPTEGEARPESGEGASGVAAPDIESDDLDPATNPVLAAALEPTEVPAFDGMEARHFLPVFEFAMKEQLGALDDLVTNPGPRPADTLRRFALSGLLLGAVQQLFSEKAAVDRDSETARLEPEVAALSEMHDRKIMANRSLRNLFSELQANLSDLELTARERWFVVHMFERFRYAGAYLDEHETSIIHEIDSKVAGLQADYKANQINAADAFEIHVADAGKLNGMTADKIENARDRAGEKGGYSLSKPTAISAVYHPELATLTDRAMRQEVYEKVSSSSVGGEYDNSRNVLNQARAYAVRAETVGYASYAEYLLSSGLLDSPEAIKEILHAIAPAVRAAARAELRQFAETLGVSEIKPWDWVYAKETLLLQRVGIDEKDIREYHELDRVLNDGLFFAAEKLFRLTITELQGDDRPPVWHNDVRVFAVVHEQGQWLGHIYFDPYSREGKNGGAWTDPVRLKFTPTGQTPLVSVHLNIEKPVADGPVLLSQDDADMLFHEFGHAFHFLLSEGTFDPANRHLVFAWIEFVAKVFQRFRKHPRVLANFAKHHETGESMPPEMIEKLDEWTTAYRGVSTVFRMAGAIIDLAWSSLSSEQIPSGTFFTDDTALVKDFEEAALTEFGLNFPQLGNSYPSQWFRHIFAHMGGFGTYYAQYWSYLVSDMLALMVFAQHIDPILEEQGGLTPKAGNFIIDNVFAPEETNLVQALRRLIGLNPNTESFLADQGLLWAHALLKLHPEATPEWLTSPDMCPPGTDLESWWNRWLTQAERAALIRAYPAEVLAMDMTHPPETVDAANQRLMKLREYARDAQTRAQSSGPTADGARTTEPSNPQPHSAEPGQPSNQGAENPSAAAGTADPTPGAEPAEGGESDSTTTETDDAHTRPETAPTEHSDAVTLTAGEALTLRLVAQGQSRERIGVVLGMSPSQVDRFLAQLADKVGTADTVRVLPSDSEPASTDAPTNLIELSANQVETLRVVAEVLSTTTQDDPTTVARETVRDFRTKMDDHRAANTRTADATQADPTDREREVLRLAAEGLLFKAIARIVDVSDTTVRNDLDSLVGKLDAPDRAALLDAAQRAWIADHPVTDPAPEPPADVKLARREMQVLHLLVQGLSNTDIAAELSVNVRAVQLFRSRLRTKLGIKDTDAMIAWAVRSGVVPAPENQPDPPDPAVEQARIALQARVAAVLAGDATPPTGGARTAPNADAPHRTATHGTVHGSEDSAADSDAVNDVPGEGQSAPRSEPQRSATEPQYQLADLDDDLPYLPELVKGLEWHDVHFDEDSVVRDENDVALNTGPDGAVFLFTPDGKRTARYPATHIMLYSSHTESGHYPYAFGHWYLTDGGRIRVTPGSQMLPKASAHPKFITQCKFEFAKFVNLRTVEFDDDLQGELWRAVRPLGVPTFDQLIERRGVAAQTVEADATMFKGGDVEFWVNVEQWEATTTGLAIKLSVGSVFGWSGELTLILDRTNGAKTAHYTDLAPGENAEQFAAAIEKFHTERVASWLAESDVVFNGFGPEQESATAVPSAPAHDADPVPPSRARHQTIAVPAPPAGSDPNVDLVRPTVDSRGWFLGPDNRRSSTTSPHGAGFLLTSAGDFVTSAHAWPEDLLATFIARGGSLDDVSGLGMWTINGPIIALDTQTFVLGETTDPMNPAQILDALLEVGADLTRVSINEISGDHQGLMWRGQASRMPVAELWRNRGLDAHRVVAGFGIAAQTGGRGVAFGVDLAGFEPTADGMSMRLLVTAARCEPALITIEWIQQGDTTEARYGAVDLGRDSEHAVAALAVVHEKLTAWFAESGVSWAEDNSAPPTENLRAEQAHGPRESAVSAQSAELVVRAEAYPHEQWTPQTFTEAANWLAQQLLGLPSHLVDTACATLKTALGDALRQRFGKLHVTVETTDELVRVTLLETTTEQVAALPEPVAAEGDALPMRSGVEFFRRPVNGWNQATWFELRIPADTANTPAEATGAVPTEAQTTESAGNPPTAHSEQPTSESTHTAIDSGVPDYIRKCLVQTVRASWAVGYDQATIPHEDADTWKDLEDSL